VGNWKIRLENSGRSEPEKDLNVVGFHFGEKITKIDSGLHPLSWTIFPNFVFKALYCGIWHSNC
jgi:hypothetical protein